MKMDELTQDAVFNGRLRIVQPRTGYRFSIDALLLADFARTGRQGRAVDLGAGAGAAGLALAWLAGAGTFYLVEAQARLAHCARLNAASFPGPARAVVIEKDWARLKPADAGGPVDVVISNPPYRRAGSGRVNPDDERALARHEIIGGIASAAEAAAGMLGAGGLFTLVYPAPRLTALFHALSASGFEPKRLRLVHSRAGENARLALVEARLGGGEELAVLPPLYVYGDGREYSEEVAAILSGDRAAGKERPPGAPASPGR